MNSYEFGQLFPKIVPEVFVYSVRLCTGGPLLPRAKFKVDLSGSFEGQLPEELEQQLVAEYTVDLFDRPHFEIIRDEVVKLNNEGMSKKSIGQTNRWNADTTHDQQGSGSARSYGNPPSG